MPSVIEVKFSSGLMYPAKVTAALFVCREPTASQIGKAALTTEEHSVRIVQCVDFTDYGADFVYRFGFIVAFYDFHALFTHFQ
jgi:hypothetical protein